MNWITDPNICHLKTNNQAEECWWIRDRDVSRAPTGPQHGRPIRLRHDHSRCFPARTIEPRPTLTDRQALETSYAAGASSSSFDRLLSADNGVEDVCESVFPVDRDAKLPAGWA